MATSTPTRQRRTQEDWDALARQLLPEIQAGTPVSGLTEHYGTNGDALRVALARIGYDPKGQPNTLEPITASRESTLAKRVAARRREGAAFWEIQFQTGKSYQELKQLLAEHGYSGKGEPTGNGSEATD